MRDENGRGRPTKLTPAVQARICEAIEDGNYYQPSCARAGIHFTSFLNWMQRGQEEQEGIYFDFFNAVTRAEAEAEAKMVSQWKEQIPEDWRAARDFLARRHPERWAPKSYLDAQVGGEITQISVDEERIRQRIDELARKKLDALEPDAD